MEKIRLKIQLAFAVVFNIGLVQWQFICFPVFNCHSCPVAVFACPLGIIGQFVSVSLIPLTVIGAVALAGLLVGRFLCGWACPFGFLQELLYKVPYIRFGIPAWTRHIKYGVFAGLVVAVPFFLGTESNLYFCRLCPVATIESSIPWAVTKGAPDLVWLAVRLAVLFTIVILVMGHRRFFCKVLCPLGACLSVFNRFAYLFPQRNEDKCVDCETCRKHCPMDPETRDGRLGAFGTRPEECISCLECQNKCPTHAINIWGG